MLVFNYHARYSLMSYENFAISAKDLSKCFYVYDTPRDRIKQLMLAGLQKLTGNVSKQYFDEFWALQDISFDITKGETVGILGRNGSGKSTLLQIICGTLTPASGNVNIQGKIAALLELGSGFNPEFTGRENIYMNATVYGLTKKEIDERFNDIAEFADIGDFIEQPIKNYSSGMIVRLAFSVIVHVDADILIIDEALAVGDAFFTQKCMRFLRNFMKTGTILFVSHDTAAVANLCNKVILLKDGKIVEIGTPKSVINHYLATLYGNDHNISSISTNSESNKNEIQPQYSDLSIKDYETTSSLAQPRDIEVSRFNSHKKAFGTGNVSITSVQFYKKEGPSISHATDGESTVLEIKCIAHKDIHNPIAGFQFKDRLGQIIFGENSLLTYQSNPLFFTQDSELIAKFEFIMPLLPIGSYSISVAIADDSKDNLIQHHWIHDALTIKVHSSSVRDGLVGVQMRAINLTIK